MSGRHSAPAASAMPAAFSTRWKLMISLLAAVAMVTSMAVFVAPKAHADNRGWLRPGCSWDAAQFWIQRCEVFSPAMGRNITVQIQPAKHGGNAGLYMLDGMRANEVSNGWIGLAHAQHVFAEDNVTVVYPVGGESSFYTDWNQPATSNSGTKIYKWETFLTRELPGYLQANFGVDPHNNAIAGLSMGGTAAINLAAHHRDQFKQVSSFSGYLHMTGIGMNTLNRLAMLEVGGYNIDQMWGGPLDLRRLDYDPWVISPLLRGMPMFLSAGGGVWNLHDSFFTNMMGGIAGIILELISRTSTAEFELKTRLEGNNPEVWYPIIGIHNWPYWVEALQRARPQILTSVNGW